MTDNVKHLKPQAEVVPPAYDELIAEGAMAALRQVLALRPYHIVIAYEPRGDDDGYAFKCFPPGESAGRYILRRIVEDETNSR